MDTIFEPVGSFLLGQSTQLVLVFAIALFASWCLRNKSAHWRYLIWLLVIGKCLTPVIVSVPIALLPADGGAETEYNFPNEVFDIELPAAFTPARESDLEFHSALANKNVKKKPSNDTTPLGSIPVFGDEASSARAFETKSASSNPAMSWTMLAWLVIATAFLTSLIGRMLETQRRLSRTRSLPSEAICELVASIANKLSIRTAPAVYLTNSSGQPFVFGWLRGDIYLPVDFSSTGSAAQQDAILSHELAHIARWDAAVNLLQMVVQSAFFFHPLVWWANNKIRQEREKCCDEIVLSGTSTQPRVYCEAIVQILDNETRTNRSQPILAVGGSTRNIEERIMTILAPKRKFFRTRSRAVWSMKPANRWKTS